MLIIKKLVKISLFQIVIRSLGLVSIRLKSALLKLIVSRLLFSSLYIFFFNLVENLFPLQLVLHMTPLSKIIIPDCVINVFICKHGCSTSLVLVLNKTIHCSTKVFHLLRVLCSIGSLASHTFELWSISCDLLYAFLTWFFGHFIFRMFLLFF